MKLRGFLLASVGLLFAAGQAHGIALGVLDNFQDGTLQGWAEGGASPNPPLNVPSGGDGGDTPQDQDAYLENISEGGNGPGSAQQFFNRDARWTGDYIAAGVNKVRVNMANFIDTPVTIGLAINNGTNCYVTKAANAALVPGVDGAGPAWSNYNFLIDPSEMEAAPGTAASFAAVAGNVTELIVLALPVRGGVGLGCAGARIFSVLGFDDFQTLADTDLDGVNDGNDNCTLAPNPPLCVDDVSIDNQTDCELSGGSWGQPDTDGDFYGNACDGDIPPGPFPSGDCVVDFNELNAMKLAFFAVKGDANYNPDLDLVFDESIDFQDLNTLKLAFFNPPGPGLGNCGCAPDVANDQGVNADFAGLQMFIRGGLVLDWGAVNGINNFVDLGAGSYQAKVQLSPGSYGYKVADFDWQLDYANEVDATVPGGAAVTLNGRCGSVDFCPPGEVDPGQGNSPIEITEAGCYQFDLVAGPPAADAPFEADTADVTVIKVD